jgi:hypothetical protein
MAIGPSHHRRHGEAGGRRQDIFINFSHLFNFALNQLPGYKLSERRGNNNRAKGHNILRSTVRQFAHQGIWAVSCNK